MANRNVFLTLLTLGMCLIFAPPSRADSLTAGPWQTQIESSLGLTQALYSDNWDGGEEGSFAWVADFHAFLTRQFTPDWFCGNEIRLALGQSHSQDKVSDKWAPPTKAVDRISYYPIIKATREWGLDPYLSGTVETQFYDDTGLRKRFLNPADLTESIGVSHNFVDIPNRSLLATRVGLALKERINVYDDSLKPGQSVRDFHTEGGTEWITDFRVGGLGSRFNFFTRVSLFQAFSRTGRTADNRWKALTGNWDNTCRIAANDFIQASLSWQLLYDKAIAPGGRFSENLVLGLTYSFSNLGKAAQK